VHPSSERCVPTAPIHSTAAQSGPSSSR
jgi:hypothetical protein